MISDKELRAAARQYEIALLRTLPEPENCAAAFSPGFERKMKKLILRTDHPFRYWLFRLLLPALAAGLAVGLAAAMLPKPVTPPPAPPQTGAPTAPAEPSLPPQTETPTAPAEPSLSPPAASQAPEPAAPAVYRPTWLPEGCAWDREALYDGEGMLVYRTPGGAEAVFLYTVGENPAGSEDPEQGRAVPVGNGTGILLLGQNKEGLSELFWSDEEAGVSFWLSAPFGEEDMIRVAESVQAEE